MNSGSAATFRPDVLHGDQGARAGEGRAEGDLQRHLLVGRPLRAPAQRGERFQDFRGGRAGIAGAQGDAGVARGQRHRLVAAQ